MSTHADLEPIDLLHLGREKVLCCWRLGDLIVDPGPTVCGATLEAALGGRVPKAILLTHIHLDHAGGTGELVKRWPGVEVYVHERGARHMIDPSKLVASAGMLYKEHMERLWGDITPVPEDSVRILKGGETLDLEGGIEVAYTPGHAQHHVSYRHLDSGMAFVGDVAGVRIPPGNATVAPTPPPDINVETWHESIELIRNWKPTSLGLTHWGLVEDPERQLDAVGSCLDDHAELARDLNAEDFAIAVKERLAKEVGAETAEAYFQASPPDQLHAGLERYWTKRAEREAEAGA
jgi:glyoxylase-like metal-dependent hydrolase (beta-lactamase superfamily II)